MNRLSILISLVLFISSSFNLSAEIEKEGEDLRRQALLKELRDYKHRFLTHELKLTKDQQKPFFKLYDEMEDETTKLNSETRELERRIAESPEDVTDLEYEKATEALFDLKIKEGEIEKSYADQFKTILTNKQLFMLKSAERNFSRDLMQHQQRLRMERGRERHQ